MASEAYQAAVKRAQEKLAEIVVEEEALKKPKVADLEIVAMEEAVEPEVEPSEEPSTSPAPPAPSISALNDEGLFDINWANPDYGRVFAFRKKSLELLRQNPTKLIHLKAYYKDHWADFIMDWGVTYDPRKPQDKYAPFILFPKQIEYIDWLQDLYTQGIRGLAEKSREVGFTWLSVAAAVCVWLFYPHAVIGFGSRKQELVDNGEHDPDSIFWKVRMFIDYLPNEFLPPEHKKGRKAMVVPNNSNKAVIKGEIGDEIGRGGRAGIYFVDEFAHLLHPEMAESALSANTDCRVYISTVNGVGNLFYKLRYFLPTAQIFIFDWKDDPRKRLNPSIPPEQEPWYLKQKRELLPTTLASQVNRSYQSSNANTFMDAEMVEEAIKRPVSTIIQPPQVAWKIGVDAAGMGNDEIVIWARRGRISVEPEMYEKMDGVQLAGLIERKAVQLLQTGPVDLISIERDGPGGSAADQLKYGPFASIVAALHTGAKLKDGKNYNLRAYLHAQAYEYVNDTECSLPDDQIFLAQATAIQASYKGGLLLIESKDDYRSRFALGKSKQEKMMAKSPDRWDAFMLTFAPTRFKPITSTESPDMFMFGKKNAGWQPKDKVMGY